MSPFFSLLLTAQLALDTNLSDVDIEGIQRSVAPINNAEIFMISAPDPSCPQTKEDGCTGEVIVRFVEQIPEKLRVSKVNGEWLVGQIEQDQIAFRECLQKARGKYMKARATGKPSGMRRSRLLAACDQYQTSVTAPELETPRRWHPAEEQRARSTNSQDEDSGAESK